MATSIKPVSRPVARLDASLLLARKGEAMPAVAATQHNNPALAWGAQPHPQDFQPHHHHHHQQQQAQLHPVTQANPQPNLQAHAQPQHPVQRIKPVATARLRSDSFVGMRTPSTGSRPCPQPQTDDVALTLRIEDEMYLRLKYLAQKSGLSTRKILNDALAFHLVRKGVPRARKMVLKPE